MRSALWVFAVGAGLNLSPVTAYPQSVGGSYTLTIGRGKPIPITSLVFGDPGINSFGAVSSEPTPVTVTAAGGVGVLGTVIRACATGSQLGKVIATYANSQGNPEYTFEFKRVSVVSIILPGVSKSAKTQDDITWTLSPGEEHFNYRLMKESGARLSSANRKRLEGARGRIQTMLWQQIRRTPWHASATELAHPAGRAFSLNIDGVDSGGVLAIGPLSVDLDTLKPRSIGRALGLLTLTVDAGRTGDFAAEIASGAHRASGTLTYYRVDPDGKQVVFVVTLKGLSFKSGPVPENEQNAKTNVLLEYESLDLKLS